MITVEQKKQLQFDARIPHLPTDLTYECRMAISGEGSRAQDWSDKPHRLVYDLSRQVEADADRIEQLEREKRESALEALAAYGQAQDAYEAQLKIEAKLAKAVEYLREIADYTHISPYGQGIEQHAEARIARAALAELEGK
jgi:vacuolar-type H+-ATPase subunit I/STV1